LLAAHPSASAQATPPAEAARATAAPARDQGLQEACDELARWAKQAGGQAGIALMTAGSARLLAAAGETAPLNPASNQKLLTAAASLARLGPQFRYFTAVYGSIQAGAAPALVLRGHGDPSLRSADLWRIAADLVDRGLRRVTGAILVDQSRFDRNVVPPAFEQQPNEWASFRAPVSAVALDGNSLVLNVVPAAAGQPAAVWFEPPGYAVTAGSVRTEAPGRGNDVRYSVEPGPGGRVRASVGGHIAEGLPRVRFSRRIDDPRLAAGYVLGHMLSRLGVEVTGQVAEGGAGERYELAVHRSEPLSKLLFALGKDSDNFYAEMLLKSLGAEVKGSPGTSARGAEVVEDWLKQVGAFAPGTRITNGSGLFDANRISALGLARSIGAAYRDPAIGPEYVAQLAIGGVDGTLRSRFQSLRATRAVRAKTGTLDRVVALSGLVLAPPGREPIAFAAIVNDLPGKHAESRRRIDRIVTQIAQRLFTP
jgi:D-alanyl-D-alanine carboxypeptidase/D-alanyl-D-alanine-endopeptidase (penicillin-binding protein 4)